MTTDILVNQYSRIGQQNPDVTTLRNGNVVVAWDSFFDESNFETYYVAARIFRPDGRPVSDEIIVSNPNLFSRYPRIDALEDGGFAVAWEAGAGSIFDRTDIYTASFDANGRADGKPVRVGPAIDDDFFAAEITATADGYVVAYSANEYESGTGRFLSEATFLRAFDEDGRAESHVRQVNAPEVADQKNPRMATLENGNVVVVFDDNYGAINEVGNRVDALKARIFGADGRPVGAEFFISREYSGIAGGFNLTKANSSVAALKGDRFAATWTETNLNGDGPTRFEVIARIFGPGGRPEGREFVVNAFTGSVPEHTEIMALDGGGFVVGWNIRSPDEGVWDDVFGQVFTETGKPVGGNFKIPVDSSYDEEDVALTPLKGGGFAAAFMSLELDGSYEAVGARFFDAPGRKLDDRRDKSIDFTGDGGRDVVKGTDDADRLDGRGGQDQLEGRGGNDRLNGGNGDDRLDGGGGRDRMTGGNGDDRMTGGGGADFLTGGKGADLLRGGAGRDRLEGGSGADRLRGDAGADMVKGGAGRDVIDGGGGRDVLWGGARADSFVFRAGSDRDIVRDFQDDVDTLRLDDALWSGRLGPRGVIERFAESGGGTTTFDFGDGDVLVLRDVSMRDLADDIAIF